MPRPIWSGAISFGLVNVPVRLFSATRSKDVRFHQLHAKDGVRIRQKRVCPADGEEVPYDDIVKGYEISPGEYVTISAEELESVAPEATKAIDIEEFVDLDQIDPMFYENSYYLVPDKGAAKAYALLRTAMQESGKVAIGRVVLRTKQYLAAIRPSGDALTLSTMLFADEVVPVSDLEGLPAGAEAAAREVAMARQLVESLATDFDPGRFRDEYRERVLNLIEQKAEGKAIVSQPEVREPTGVVDLMAALEASLAEAKSRKAAADPAPAKPARSRRKPAADADANGSDGGSDGAEAKPRRTRRAKAAS
jgi:DNA end-binding protein Ku